MKRLSIYFLTISVLAVGLVSCEKMLSVSSDRYLYAKDNKLDSPNDSLYSVAGILSKLQLLGDRYVMLGELRADMMDVTHNATDEFRELSSLNVSADNPFVDVNDYYVVINHCNYLIQNMDTSVMVGGERYMKREYAIAKAVRAWTYLQLALNYGKAVYFEDPVLTIVQNEKISRDASLVKTREEIFDLLIADLLPIQDVNKPVYGDLSIFSNKNLFLSVHYLLGELYLWKNMYPEAAAQYYAYIVNENQVVSNLYRCQQQLLTDFEGRVRASGDYTITDENAIITYEWMRQFVLSASNEVSSLIPYYYTNAFGEFYASQLVNYTKNRYLVAPSQRAIDLYAGKPFLQAQANISYDADGSILSADGSMVSTTGDLRGYPAMFKRLTSNLENMSAADYTDQELERMQYMDLYKEELGTYYIDFYGRSAQDYVILQRGTLGYLRYAEAVNRMGKPSLAMAVLNNGLKSTTVNDSLYINQNELDSTLRAQWSLAQFSRNIGTVCRGEGLSQRVLFLTDLENLQDSINYVESVLIEEMGLETAFQGNRFHDLMRMTHHRPEANYIGEALSAKFPARRSEFMAKGEGDWYLPYPGEE
ncbi:MAG: RagB/SusD family nutrient uptake outer membrane protein [Bacteroidales bacterium]|nr:RagB/SusD family nutrient uptake outer membrane protein [Bacteroidales bacterium]